MMFFAKNVEQSRASKNYVEAFLLKSAIN